MPARNAQWSIGHQREDYGSIVVYKEARVSGADVGCFFGKYVTLLYVVSACGCSIADGKRGWVYPTDRNGVGWKTARVGRRDGWLTDR